MTKRDAGPARATASSPRRVHHPAPRSPIAPSPRQAWITAIRPKTLPAAVSPVLVGSACAWTIGELRGLIALAALVGALLLQIASNLANDVLDFEKGLDTHERLGPTRVTHAGMLEPAQVRAGLGIVIALALLIGVYLTYVAGFVVVVIGLASIAAAIAYTGGPYPLGYHGLGEVAVMIFFGFVAVCGTVYVQALEVPQLAWWCAIPVGSLTTAILVVNNLRDIETDARGGKRTVAVRIGRRGTIAEYRLLLLAAYVLPIALVLTGELHAWALLPLATLPLALGLTRRIASDKGRELNQTLAATAKLLFAHSLLFAIGITVGAA